MNKKTILGIAVIALMAILVFTACSKSGGNSSGGGGKSLNSATELKEYLDKQPANSPDQPIKVAMKANDMMIGDIAKVIKEAGKYVSLDLSGSPLTEINAFGNCKTLVGIIIPNGVTSIGDRAFDGCTSLTSVTIPNSVTSIGYRAFYSCDSLTSITIPNSVTSIGQGAFYGCDNLTNITIPNSVTSIGGQAFPYNSSITVDSGNPNYASEGRILYNKAKTEIVFVPKGISGNVTIANGVTSISAGEFENCGSLTSVIIPNSVTSIGRLAFGGCDSLTSVTIGNSVTSIGEGAFQGCNSLTSITIPNSVTYIGDQAFANHWLNTGPTSVTISRKTIIGRGAFLRNAKITYSD